MGRFSIAAAGVWALAACGIGRSTLQQPTSRAIGCPEQAVEISQDVGGFGGRTWVAHCEGRRYECHSSASEPAPECTLDD